MAQNLVKIDNTYYDVRIPEDGIKRNFQVLDDNSTTRVADGSMHRSIIGTYYNYTITFDCSDLSDTQYDSMYEVLSAPVNSHEITVPYGQSTLTFNAYVTAGEDTLEISTGTRNRWKGLSVQFIAMAPKRT